MLCPWPRPCPIAEKAGITPGGPATLRQSPRRAGQPAPGLRNSFHRLRPAAIVTCDGDGGGKGVQVDAGHARFRPRSAAPTRRIRFAVRRLRQRDIVRETYRRSDDVGMSMHRVGRPQRRETAGSPPRKGRVRRLPQKHRPAASHSFARRLVVATRPRQNCQPVEDGAEPVAPHVRWGVIEPISGMNDLRNLALEASCGPTGLQRRGWPRPLADTARGCGRSIAPEARNEQPASSAARPALAAS